MQEKTAHFDWWLCSAASFHLLYILLSIYNLCVWISARQKLSKLMYCISWHMDSKLPSVKRQRRVIQKWRMPRWSWAIFGFLFVVFFKFLYRYLKQSFYKIINWWKIIHPASLFFLFAQEVSKGRFCIVWNEGHNSVSRRSLVVVFPQAPFRATNVPRPTLVSSNCATAPWLS